MKTSSIYFIAAFIFTFILGYVDEGYYNLKTFESLGNWLVLSVYLIVFWACELLLDMLLSKIPIIPGLVRIILCILLGLALPLIAAYQLAP